jgi:EpsI family protein
LGALFAGSMYVSWPRRALVMVIAVVVPIIANGIRAFGIILLAYLSDNELATGVDHLIYGWLFFTLVSCVVLAIGISFREPQPDFDKWGNGQISRKMPLGRCVLAAAAAFLLVGAARIYGDHVDQIWSKQPIQLQTPQFTGYPQREAIDDQFLPRFPSADSEIDAAYGSGEQNFYLRIGYYLSERRGVQAISFNHELPGSPEMLIVSKGETQTMLGKDAISIRYQRIASGNKGRLIWYWFWVDGRMIGNPYAAKLFEAKAKLLGGRQPAAVIALAVDYRGDPASAENALHAFMRDAEPLYGALDHAQPP